MTIKKAVFSSIIVVFLLIITGTLSYYLAFPQVVRCYAIGFSDFEKYSDHLYFSEGTTPLQKDSLLQLFAGSKKRISRLWGSYTSAPTIVFCHTEEIYSKYGSTSGSPANFFGTPLGLYVVVSPDGLNTDIISHEMCHAELAQRLGWLTMTSQIPQWFNEGVALMADYRYPDTRTSNRHNNYLQKWNQATSNGVVKIKLSEISSVKDFFNGDQYWIYLAYLRSGLEVSRWLEIVKRDGLLDLVKKLNEGEDFDSAYSGIEQRAKS